MRVFFSFDYKGGNAYLGMKKHPLMMDVIITDIDRLLDFMELRLGLHTVSVSQTDRLVAYYKSVREYMSAHADDQDNQLYGSYTVSPLATSHEMLRWRDALAACGWTKDSPAPSRRLKVLRDVEHIFAQKGCPDVRVRYDAIVRRLRQRRSLMQGVTFIMPFDVDLLHPALREIFTLACKDGAKTERLAPPAAEGDSNLATLKRLLTDNGIGSVTLKPDDDSVRIWRFKDDMEAEEYLAMMGDDAFDVCIQPDTKLKDNFLHMMGKPVTGSSVSNSAPQIVQLFFTGVAMLARPLNIAVLLQWLYAPIHPLPASFRYRLAERLARAGGWMPDNTAADDTVDCHHLVEEWTECRYEEELTDQEKEREREVRRHKAAVFLPDFEGGSDPDISAERLHTFLKKLCAWSNSMSAIMSNDNADDPRIPQLHRLSELCGTLLGLTDNLKDSDSIAYNEIEKHTACLYEASEFMQYSAQASPRHTISVPGQMAATADRVLWCSLHDFKPMLPDTDFLTPTERMELQRHFKMWEADDMRRAEQQTMLLPLLFCQRQLTLVTVESVGGNMVCKHPMIVRIEQQVRNHEQLTACPTIDDNNYEPVSPLGNNAVEDSNGFYTHIKNTALIQWRKSESPTSLERLIQDPIDYTLENIAHISDNGQSDLGDVNRTKGNVAHAVIQHLFTAEGQKANASHISQRVKADYDTVFNKVVETKGAILLLPENAIERRQLHGQLRECIDNLIDIIAKDDLTVVECEKSLRGNTFGTPDDETPEMHGFADMVLERRNGQHIIFDFKWTGSKSYYQGLLRQNRSSQLAIYADLLGRETGNGGITTAYFLMPRGRLYSTESFISDKAETITVDEGCGGDVISRLQDSYHYRRKEIMSGKVEMGEGLLLDELDYFNDTETDNLFPLKPLHDNKSMKDIYGFSSYSHLKE